MSLCVVERSLPAATESRGRIVLFGAYLDVPDTKLLKLLGSLGMVVHKPLEDHIRTNQGSASASGIVVATVEADVVARVRGLGQLVMERNGLGGRRLVGGEHLDVVEALLVSDDEVSDGGATDVVHLVDGSLVQTRGPLFS